MFAVVSDTSTRSHFRLVLIVSDGLRAESFFEQNLERTKFLKNVLLTRGMVGISHTRVPTESRPGHVAMIAGLYEDPSSIFKGWQENPVEFDSVFNRSSRTFAWGSPDIVPMFSKGATRGRVVTEVYRSEDEVFSASAHTYLLDKWVFDRVKHFLADQSRVRELKSQERVIFFLHLLGMDTSGHTHKPHSIKYTENLKYVDRGIGEIARLFEEKFADGKTAFVFTSDHGMTNRGSHGSGQKHETETPLLAWGAGVNYWKPASEDFLSKSHVTVDDVQIPRYDVQQADIAVLMSTLIGIPCPTNSHGRLPYTYPNVSKVYLANAFANNAYQLHAIYSKLHEQSQKRFFQFSLNPREKLINDEINFLDEQVKLSFTIQDQDDIIIQSNKMITAIYDGIDFYFNFYKNELLIALTLSMIAWIVLLYQFIMTSRVTFRMRGNVARIGGAAVIVILVFNHLQRAPLVVSMYFALPIIMWMLVITNNGNKILQNFFQDRNQILLAIVCFAIAELLVFSFFQRKILSLLLLGYVGSIAAYATRRKYQPKLKIMKYFSSAVCLGIFPLLKVVDKDTKNSVLL